MCVTDGLLETESAKKNFTSLYLPLQKAEGLAAVRAPVLKLQERGTMSAASTIATASVQASSKSAEAMHPLQQDASSSELGGSARPAAQPSLDQGQQQRVDLLAGCRLSAPAQQAVATAEESASPAQHEGSARRADDSGPSQNQEGSTGSSRFNPAQQAVVTALMVVMKRAAKDGREAASAAKLTLVSNNVATWPLLSILPEDGALPTVKQVEDRASDKLLESLTKLAELCAAAQCQPLEVFTRSVQCTAHRAAANSIAAFLRMHKRQQQKQLQHVPPSWRQERLQYFQQVVGQQSLADVMVGFIHVAKVHSIDNDAVSLFRPYLNHILPGRLQSSTQHIHNS